MPSPVILCHGLRYLRMPASGFMGWLNNADRYGLATVLDEVVFLLENSDLLPEPNRNGLRYFPHPLFSGDDR